MFLKIILIVLLILVVLYLWMIMPRIAGRPDDSMLKGRYYAHRGLHFNKSDAPENSMAAFKKAVDAGYGIEMDVQLTKDRIPVVFHDETLKRVCGAEGKIRDFTYEELQQFHLYQSNEKIPRFSDFLNLVNGKVPLIIEIKIYEGADTVCKAVDELLSTYEGPYCMESFHTMAVAWYKKHRPKVIRGQLSSDFNEPGKRESGLLFMVHYLLLDFLGRPDFIAYDRRHKENISRRLCRYLFKALSVAWTVKSQEQLESCKKDFDLFIFEGFIPKEK